MSLTILGIVLVLMIPVGVAWRVSFNMLGRNPTPQVKAAFWALSAVFIVLAFVAFVAVSYL